MDEIAICCFARMYHIHVAVIMGLMFWILEKTKIFISVMKLGFIGSLSFISMKWKTSTGDTDPEPGTSGLGKYPDKPAEPAFNTYNLWPRKEQLTCPVSPEKSPEPDGYDLHSKNKKITSHPNQSQESQLNLQRLSLLYL